MAIQFVQTIEGSGNNINTITYTLGGSTIAGNFLAMCNSVWDVGIVDVAPTGLGTWNQTTSPTSPDGNSNAFIYYNENCSAGTQVTIDYGTSFYIEGSLSEFSGLLTSGSLDQQNQQSKTAAQADTTPDTPSTGTTTQEDELVLACLDVDASVANVGIDAATTGYTNLHVFQNPGSGGTQGHSSDYKIVSAIGAQSAAWGTLAGNYDWTAKIATFKAAEAAVEEPQLLSPIEDISDGVWAPSSAGSALWEMLDADKSPDTDYAYTVEASEMEVKFASGNTPTVQTGHIVRYRLMGNGTTDAIVKLKCGAVVIAQWTEANVPAVETDYSHTLDSSPSFTISDYTDLRLSVEAA